MIPRCFDRILETIGEEGRGYPTSALRSLFALVGTAHDGTVLGMAEAAKAWRTGEFQYRIKDKLGSGSLELALPYLAGMEFVHERKLGDEEWEEIRMSSFPLDVAICGARFTAMRKRLQIAADRVPNDVCVSRLVTLGSIRGLDLDELRAWEDFRHEDLFRRPLSQPTIEADLAWGIVEVLKNRYFPWNLREATYDRICAPPRKMPEDLPVEEIRKWKPEPGFADTLDAWIEQRAAVGQPLANHNVLFVTSGPSFDRVWWIAQRKLPDCLVHVIGYEAPASLNLNQYLNELAMLLFECDAWLRSLAPSAV